MSEWTDEAVEKLSQMWNIEGKTASECARELGASFTRNAVIGKAHRLKFPKRRTRKIKRKGWSPEARAAALERRNAMMRAKRAAEAMAKLPPKFVPRKSRAAVVVALPRAGASDRDLVNGWLAQHGGPRRFEEGATGDPGMIALWLRSKGFQTSYRQGGGGGVVHVVYPDGRKASLTMKKLTDLADSLRIAEGLEPIIAREAA